jgi:hypothetical protein
MNTTEALIEKIETADLFGQDTQPLISELWAAAPYMYGVEVNDMMEHFHAHMQKRHDKAVAWRAQCAANDLFKRQAVRRLAAEKAGL